MLKITTFKDKLDNEKYVLTGKNTQRKRRSFLNYIKDMKDEEGGRRSRIRKN